MKELKEQEIKNALQSVIDPDLKRDIVSLGMVKEITITPENVRVVIDLTTPACPLKDVLEKDIRNALTELIGTRKLEVSFTATSQRWRNNTTQMLPQVKHLIAVASGKVALGNLQLPQI